MSTPNPPPRSEPPAFAEIYDRYADDVHRYLRRRLGGDVADDLTADTFVAAFRSWSRFDPTAESARPWLFGIASNLAAKHRRSEVRGLRAYARSGVDPVASSWAEAADDRVSAQAMNRELATALSELSAGERDVLLLVAWAELSYAEVAAALHLPVGTVRSRLNRARRKVRTTLSPGTERVAVRPLTALEARGGNHG
ncbi:MULTISPECIES: RNA polymerase sigma factor [unclassified Nocardioides]|uniref:RNA polymerase sigma factor n=1 Tax=unclassified Nocardioides TaxID=2615069 RepID=UPI0009E99049|nr:MULTISPECIES: sigma-70 family RNA polymerase sigma factor [unclassified Nocardioides]